MGVAERTLYVGRMLEYVAYVAEITVASPNLSSITPVFCHSTRNASFMPALLQYHSVLWDWRFGITFEHLFAPRVNKHTKQWYPAQLI